MRWKAGVAAAVTEAEWEVRVEVATAEAVMVAEEGEATATARLAAVVMAAVEWVVVEEVWAAVMVEEAGTAAS